MGFWPGAGYPNAVSSSGNSYFPCRKSPTSIFCIGYFAISPLCSLSRLPMALCYHLLYAVLTSSSPSFEHQLEIYSEILKSAWVSVRITGQQKQELMQSAGGSAESPLLMFYIRHSACLLSSSSPEDTGWFISLPPQRYWILVFYKNGNLGQWKLVMRYPALTHFNGEGKIKQMEASAIWLRGSVDYCMATVRGRSL